MQQDIAALRKQRHRSFMMKGIAFAVASGICYGLYTAFLTLGETQGVWGAWFAGEAWNGNAPLSAFAITFTLAALAAGLNDLFSGGAGGTAADAAALEALLAERDAWLHGARQHDEAETSTP